MSSLKVKGFTSTAGTYTCSICNVDLSNGNKSMHENGKKHLGNKRILSSVYVSNVPRSTSVKELSSYFTTFGTVFKMEIHNSRGTVEFDSPDVLSQVLETDHFMNGVKLSVQRRHIPKNPLHTAKTNSSSSQNSQNMRKDHLFEKQVEKFVKSTRLTLEEISRREDLVSTINDAFQEFFPGSLLQAYGSSVNNLGVQGCDLDTTFFLPCQRDEASLKQMQSHHVPRINNIRSGKIKKDLLMRLHGTNLLEVLYKILSSLPDFKAFNFSPNKISPFVQAYNNHFRIHCIIYYNQGLGVANSRLLGLYDQMDVRIHKLLMLLRHWVKNIGLVGSRYGLSSYSFSWLVIFFLQQRRFVPVVETLMELAEDRLEAESWECSFCEDFSLIPPVTRKDTLAELLVGFFKFYSFFNFDAYIICPRDGTFVLKSDLLSLAGSNLDFDITSMSVQDVFDLTRNITCYVSDSYLKKFIDQSNKLYPILQRELDEGKLGLNTLFRAGPETAKKEPTVVRQKTSQPSKSSTPISTSQNRAVKRPLESDESSENIPGDSIPSGVLKSEENQNNQLAEDTTPDKNQKTRSTNNSEQENNCVQSDSKSRIVEGKMDDLRKKVGDQYSVLCKLFLDIFRKAFLFECVVKYTSDNKSEKKPVADVDGNAPKRQKLASSGDTEYFNPNDEILILHVLCKLYYRTWNKRKMIKLEEATSTPNLMVTEEDLARKRVKSSAGPKKLLHAFEAVLVSTLGSTNQTLKLRMIAKNRSRELNYILLPFLRRYIHVLSLACIETYLKDEKS